MPPGGGWRSVELRFPLVSAIFQRGQFMPRRDARLTALALSIRLLLPMCW